VWGDVVSMDSPSSFTILYITEGKNPVMVFELWLDTLRGGVQLASSSSPRSPA